MKKLFLIIAICLFSSACVPTSSSKPSGNTPAPESQPKAPIGGGQGTSSNGGGGNTINGKPIESYARSIESLPEFKKHVLPVIQRLSGENSDVLIVYLRWSIRTKPWYFVPVKLDTLSQSQTGLPFYSDQIARNTKDSVYIDAAEYNALPLEERARLLMHEMVMSSRFLMKQTPQAQCLALSRSRDLAVCKNEEIMKTGVDAVTNEADRDTLTAGEHERVRLMTNFLMDEKKNISNEEVTAMRMRLGFHFPWDSMISNLQPKDLDILFTRAEISGDRFQAVGPSFMDSLNAHRLTPEMLTQPRDCLISIERLTMPPTKFLILGGYIGRGLQPGLQPLKGVSNAETINNAVQTETPYAAFGHSWQSYLPISSSSFAKASYIFKGVRRGDLSSDVIDLATVLPATCHSSGGYSHCYIVEFYIARSPYPRILEYKVTPVRTIDEEISGIFDPTKKREYVPVFGQTPLVCRLADRIDTN